MISHSTTQQSLLSLRLSARNLCPSVTGNQLAPHCPSADVEYKARWCVDLRPPPPTTVHNLTHPSSPHSSPAPPLPEGPMSSRLAIWSTNPISARLQVLSLPCRLMRSKLGHKQVAQVLVEHNVDTSNQERRRVTALHLALFGDHVNLAAFLIEHGVDATAQGIYGRTPLHIVSVSRGRNVDPARLLVEHGADKIVQD